MNNAFLVKTKNFEGPLDLLYTLIQKRKLQINTISLSEITAEYLEHVKSKKNINLLNLSEFVYYASILILIKTKSLLPILEYTEGEEEDLKMFEYKLNVYAFMKKNVFPKLDTWKKRAFFVRAPVQKIEAGFNPDKNCSRERLDMLAKEILNERNFLLNRSTKTIQKIISVEEMMKSILDKISDKINIQFKDLQNVKKQDVVIAFLSILELFKNEKLDLTQPSLFGNIELTQN